MTSLWQTSLTEANPAAWAPRPMLPGDASADVAIVGAGLTGIWTAYYLHELDPSLRIVLLDAHLAGFGASGRNGGWLSALLPMGLDTMAATHGRDAAVRLQRLMFESVDEVLARSAQHGIDCHAAKGGTISAARSQPQLARLRAEIEHVRSWGFGDDDYRLLDAEGAAEHMRPTRLLGASYTPHCAAVHPARLVRGMAEVIERRGAVIHERTPVERIDGTTLHTPAGRVRASMVVRATEAFTATLPGHRRDIAPVYSLMIATEPLPAEVFDDIGLDARQTFNDTRRMVIYGQRTADDRIAFGGRGAPYHFGSRIRPGHDLHAGVHASLEETLRDMFPVLGDARITHRWGGPVGIPRDWYASVGFDPVTGHAWAGGYVGDGLTTTNLAGRTLAHLITGTDSELTSMPWVNHRSPRWEPEPLRWLGINSMVKLPSGADAHEERTGQPERWRSAILDRVLGH
jgi:glycine/D-amino acid oxidase-like deaminating enzyme